MDKILVAYFSASGVTKRKAMQLAKVLGADTYEIIPKVPYSKEDLNWMNKDSRSSLEMKDKTYRPEREETKLDLTNYDTIYLGFPIWWYVAPTIVNTFLESYDFSGKKIIVFATSGGSGFGRTVEELKVSVSSETTMIQGIIVKSEEDIKQLAELS